MRHPPSEASSTGSRDVLIIHELSAAMHQDRQREIRAAVTDGNTPSERLLRSVGFEQVTAL